MFTVWWGAESQQLDKLGTGLDTGLKFLVVSCLVFQDVDFLMEA